MKGKKAKTTKPVPPPPNYEPRLASAKTNTIRKWRVFRGIKSQGELAKKANLTRATVSRLESGQLRYNEDRLKSLARVLKCETWELIRTDPTDRGDIFNIYRGLSDAAKKRFEAAIKDIAPE